MFVNGSLTKCAIVTEDFPYMLPTKFRFIWPNGFRGEESKKSANQNRLWWPCLQTDRDERALFIEDLP